MRVLAFSTYYPPFTGGAEIALHELTRHLPDIEFDLVTARGDRHLPQVETAANVTLYRVGLGVRADKYIIPSAAYRRGAELVRRHNYTAILSVMASYAGLAAIRVRARYKHLPLILNLQEGRDFSRSFGSVKERLFRTVVSRADRITAISRHLGTMAERFGAQSDVIQIIPNGVDLARFGAPQSRDTRNCIRRRLGLRRGEYLMISTSRFDEKNGLEHVIRALPYILERRSVKLLLMGHGRLAGRLQQVARSVNVGSRVILHPPLDHARLVTYLAAADVFVRPSLSEGFGNSFIEAMAAGVPVVATNVGGISDFLRAGTNGIACEPQNPRSVAKAVLRILEDPALRHRLVAAGRATANRYTWDNIAAAYRSLFSRCAYPSSTGVSGAAQCET